MPSPAQVAGDVPEAHALVQEFMDEGVVDAGSPANLPTGSPSSS
ncbi:hypothetical protein [Streptomyces sp. Y7]